MPAGVISQGHILRPSMDWGYTASHIVAAAGELILKSAGGKPGATNPLVESLAKAYRVSWAQRVEATQVMFSVYSAAGQASEPGRLGLAGVEALDRGPDAYRHGLRAAGWGKLSEGQRLMAFTALGNISSLILFTAHHDWASGDVSGFETSGGVVLPPAQMLARHWQKVVELWSARASAVAAMGLANDEGGDDEAG